MYLALNLTPLLTWRLCALHTWYTGSARPCACVQTIYDIRKIFLNFSLVKNDQVWKRTWDHLLDGPTLFKNYAVPHDYGKRNSLKTVNIYDHF